MTTDTKSRAEESYIIDLAARRLYLEWCQFKDWEPRPYPYSGDNFRAYAATILRYTGWDDTTIEGLERDCVTDRGEIR
jgi:hypothetical protein